MRACVRACDGSARGLALMCAVPHHTLTCSGSYVTASDGGSFGNGGGGSRQATGEGNDGDEDGGGSDGDDVSNGDEGDAAVYMTESLNASIDIQRSINARYAFVCHP